MQAVLMNRLDKVLNTKGDFIMVTEVVRNLFGISYTFSIETITNHATISRASTANTLD